MTIYHRHLDHDWQAARREINYSLFGNTAGKDVPSNKANYGETTQEWKRTNWLWVKYCVAQWSRKPQRVIDLAWLKFKEGEAW